MFVNINPTLWGPTYWETAHIITFSYPEMPTNEDKETIKEFFSVFKKVLPCEKCRVHFSEKLDKFPLNDDVLKTKYSLIVWLINVHNEVNKMLGKKAMNVNDVIAKYSNSSSKYKNKHLWTLILVIILIIILIIYMRGS